MMMLKALVATGLIGLGAGSAMAETVNFAFTFTNPFGVGNGVVGDVFGEVLGLEDNATSRATSVKVVFAGNAVTIGEYVSAHDPLPNAFTVVDGAITTFDFRSAGVFNAAPALTCCTLDMWRLGLGDQITAGLSNAPNGVDVAPVGNFEFTRMESPNPPPVPVPAPALLLAAGLGALGGVGRRRRRSAA